MSSSFKAFRHFNRQLPDLALDARVRPDERSLAWFAGDGLECKLARALLRARAVPWKELLESFETFERLRGVVRAPVVADLCCGHGLTGMLYGVFHRDVDTVMLVDRVCPPSQVVCLEALCTVAPWLRAKVRVVEAPIDGIELPEGTAVIGVHACGSATDAVLDAALACGGPVGVLPCCHAQSQLPGPPTLGQALGVALATDVHRTYRLEAAGRRVRWTELPEGITAMNRLILAW